MATSGAQGLNVVAVGECMHTGVPGGHDFLSGGGELGALMRSRDWSRTPLGDPAGWPQSLRSAISILLPSRAQICLFWGPDLIALYNDAYRPTLGLKHPWALGQPAREVWKEFWDDVLRPLLEQVLRTGEAFWANDYPFFLQRHGFPEETYFDISYDPVRDESGGVGGVFCIVSETTGRVVGERRLRLLREVSRVAGEAQNMQEAFRRVAEVLQGNSLDLPFGLLFENPRGSSMTPRYTAGFGIDAIVDVAWPFGDLGNREIVVDGDMLACLPRVTGNPWPEAVKTAVVLPIVGTGQEPLGYLVAGISPRRALDDLYFDFLRMIASNTASTVGAALALAEERERARALAELDRAKTLFFSNVSHEFRTPLTLMLGPIEECLNDPTRELAQSDRSRLELAHRNALRLLKLVNALLDFSRIEAGRVRAAYQRTDICDFTTELASNFRSATNSAGIRLLVECAPIADPVYVDPDMWEKIVLNLISNAFKFTFEGEISVRVGERDGFAELVVSDTGTGIPAEELPRLFERFHRVEDARGRTFEGTGIGLALVQELVKLHGGDVSVESEIGKGSAFTVRIPTGSAHLPAEHIVTEQTVPGRASRATAFVHEALRWLPEAGNRSPVQPRTLAAIEEVDEVPSAAGDGRRVLIADDNADMRDYLDRLLAGQGYRMKSASNGEEALAAALRDPPDLILADVMMPRMDGFELLRRLRAVERTKDVPLIMLSARAGEEAKVEGLEAGADDYLVKPFSARELFARVSSAIALRAARRKAADAAREESARIRRLFGQAPGFIAILNGPEHRFEFANESYRRLVGDRELIGRSVREAFPDLEGQGFFELLDQVYRTRERFVGERVAVRFALQRGGPIREVFIDFIYEPIVNESSSPTGIFVEGYEVTERVRAEAELRESEARFRTFAENIPTLCWMARPDGHVFWYNSRWYEYTGKRPKEQEGWDWQSVHDPKMLPTVMQGWRHSLESGEPFEMTFPLKGADGLFRQFLARVVPARDESGKVVRWFGTHTDITAQQEYEQHLQMLIDELNHRVKNTLAVVQSLAAQTFRKPSDTATARKTFEDRLMALSSAHTLLTRETWKGAGLRQVLDASLNPFIDKASNRINLQGPPVWIPPRMVLALSMALHELATNATKYGALSNDNGRVDVRWTVDYKLDDPLMTLTWAEIDGPPVAQPKRRGFGSKLIESGLAADIGGKVAFEFRACGVVCTIETQLPRLREGPVFTETAASTGRASSRDRR